MKPHSEVAVSLRFRHPEEPRVVQCVTKGVLDLKMKVLSAELSVHRGSDLGEWRRQRRRPKPRENRPPWAVMQTGRP